MLARPAGCDGRMGSREWLCEAALGDAGSQRTSSSLNYKRVASAGSRAAREIVLMSGARLRDECGIYCWR